MKETNTKNNNPNTKEQIQMVRDEFDLTKKSLNKNKMILHCSLL